MDSTVTIVNNTVLCTWIALKCSQQKNKKTTIQGDGWLINLIVEIISQHICILNHHVVYFRSIQIYLLKKEKERKEKLGFETEQAEPQIKATQRLNWLWVQMLQRLRFIFTKMAADPRCSPGQLPSM